MEEFITDDFSKEIHNQCDVKQLFKLKGRSEHVVDYQNLTSLERSYITGAT